MELKSTSNSAKGKEIDDRPPSALRGGGCLGGIKAGLVQREEPQMGL